MSNKPTMHRTILANLGIPLTGSIAIGFTLEMIKGELRDLREYNFRKYYSISLYDSNWQMYLPFNS